MFDLGQLVATPGALQAFARNRQTPLEFVQRHANHDWGDVDDDDKRENDYSVKVIAERNRLNDILRRHRANAHADDRRSPGDRSPSSPLRHPIPLSGRT